MTALILRKFTLLAIFCNIFNSNQDFLEYYQPRPGFPKELNDWLAYVQTHRDDFRIIRNIAKRRKEEGEYFEERKTRHMLLGDLEEEDEEEIPQNDIFPRSDEERTDWTYKSLSSSLDKQKKKKLSNNLPRNRRESNTDTFFEHSNTIEVDPRSKSGEVKRSEPKYPDQFVNRAKEDVDKREIQIDILNDGKLVKTIRDGDKNPKSIVLNIQNSDGENHSKFVDKQLKFVDSHPDIQPKFIDNQQKVEDSQPKFSAHSDLEPTFKNSQPKVEEHLKFPEIPNIPINSPQRSVEIENNAASNKELAANYHNLYTANENLNTDSSVARDALAKTALMYHVTLPDPNFIIHHDNPNTTYDQNSFQRNNFRDMSKYWSASEKNQLQQGIDFAQETENFRRQQLNAPQKGNDGFEVAKTVIVEHVIDKPNAEGRQQQNNRLQTKRNLGSLDGKIQLDSFSVSSPNIQDVPFDQSDYTMKNNPEDVRQVQVNQYMSPPPVSRKNIKTKNPQPQPQKIDENINNHIAITIIEPQKDEEPKEEFKKDSIVETFVIPTPTNEETIPDSNQEDNIEECTSPSNSNDQFKQKEVVEINNAPQSSTEYSETNRENDANRCEKGQCDYEETRNRNQYNDIQVQIEPQQEKTNRQENSEDRENDQKRYFSGQQSPDLIHIPLTNSDNYKENLIKKKYKESPCRGSNCNDKETSCVGPNCAPYKKRFSRVKHKRKRGRRKYKHRVYDNSDDQQMSYKLRQLKSAEYAYDADTEGSEDDYIIETISSERTKRLNNKKSVEGDYGDEEDSMASKNNASKLIKQSDNPFANPHSTSEPDDDDDEYYDENIDKKQNSKKDNVKHKIKFNTEDDKVSIGKRVHKKIKVPSKQTQNNDVKVQIREPRSSNEDLRQLPKFVIDDQLNEENLRKRSLANQKEIDNNKFPLSSKSFFASNNPQRRDSNDADVFVDKQSAQFGPDKSSTSSDPLIMGDFGDSNSSFTGGSSNDFSEISENPTSAVTEECDSSTVNIGPVCATDNFTDIKVTTMLNLVGEAPGDMNGSLPSMNEQYQNLEDILIGRLPLSIVDSVFTHMKAHPSFKLRFFKGMRKKNAPISFRNLPEVSGRESIKLIRLMSKIMNRLQWTTTCQTLPVKLKRYLKAITQVKVQDRLMKTKAMEEVDFEDSQNQTNFIFHSNNGVDNIEEKVRILKNMLSKYEHLPESCKPRAEPVKEYIENHLDMLTHVMSNNMGASKPSKSGFVDTAKQTASEPVHHEASKRNEKDEGSDMIEHELESLGLGKHPNFRRHYDLDTLVNKAQGDQEDKKQVTKKTKKRDINREISDEYERLLEAVKKERIKREGRKRLAEAFGKLSIDDYNGKNSDNSIKEIFENPLVYSF